jgi:S-adenosylmethionine synthetase
VRKGRYLFTSESVSEGHPDKVCDRISDAIVDTFLTHDPQSRVAVETMATTNRIVLGGEVRGPAAVTAELLEEVARHAVKEIGYEQDGFHWRKALVENHIHEQSADIAVGVDASGNKDEGAGDQGIMFGYACLETQQLMPAPIHLSHSILRSLAEARHSGAEPGLGPDAKSQVTLEYLDGKPQRATSVVVPDGDCGLTGRKIIVDTYGGAAPHGGGAFSGKDPTKVDRSAAYAARYLAKNVVAAGLAERCTIQLSYAIGVSKPLSVYVDTHQTGRVDEDRLSATLQDKVDLSPRGIREHLALSRPVYARTAAYGHFGRAPDPDGGFSWESLDLVEALKSDFNA